MLFIDLGGGGHMRKWRGKMCHNVFGLSWHDWSLIRSSLIWTADKQRVPQGRKYLLGL